MPNAKRDPKSGKFLPGPETAEDIAAGLAAFNDVIDVKVQLKKLHAMSMRYLTGKIKLDPAQARLLNDMYKILTDKLAPNAKGGETGPTEIDVVIKGPKK